jgi:hypothetical protein
VGSNPIPPALVLLAVALTMLVACSGPEGDPAHLDGAWRDSDSDARLRVSGHSWELSSGKLVKSGAVEVTPRRVAFVLERTNTVAFDLYCREKVDVYDWFIEDERLLFRTVGRPCDRAARAVLTSGHWRRT